MRGVVFTPVVGEKFRSVVGVHAELVVAGNRDEAIAAARSADFFVTDGSSYDAAFARALIADKGQLRWVQLVSMGYDGLTQHGVPAGVVVADGADLFCAGRRRARHRAAARVEPAPDRTRPPAPQRTRPIAARRATCAPCRVRPSR